MNMKTKYPFLVDTENRKTFFRRIARYYPTLDPRYKEIERAYNCAKDGFREKYREGGERYFEHIRAVCLFLIVYLRVKDHRLIIALLLHDNVEDLPWWTLERIQKEFGEYVALLVEYMSKPSEEDYPDKVEREAVYHARFRFAPREFFLMKLCDRLHNILTLGSCLVAKRKRKIEETRRYYLPYAEEHLILLHELEEAIEEIEKTY